MSTYRSLIGQAKLSTATSAAVACGGGAAIGGLVSMLGWILGIPRLTDWDNNGVTIKFNATLSITSLGLAVVVAALFPERRTVVGALAGIAIAIGALTLLEHTTGVDLGIDTIFVYEAPGALATSSPGRMGIPGSLSITLLGGALLLNSFRRSAGLASVLGLAVALIAWMPISGYIFGAPQLFAFVPFTSIALQTAFFLLFLGIGVVALVPDRGLAEVLSRPDAGGRLFRALFVPLILLSVGLNWIRLISVNSGAMDFAFSGAVRSILELVVLIGLLWWTASGMSRADSAKASERKALSEVDAHRMINAAQEQERRRIARDLHDSVGQELTGLRLLLHNLPDKYGDENLKLIENQAARLDAELSMLVWQLRPKVLDTYGLADALDNFSRAWASNNGLDIRFACSMPKERLRSDIETNLYRIVQEALNNIQKHARAKNVVISLSRFEDNAVLAIQDDGVGFSENDEPIHNTESGGFGMIGMRERAALVGGSFDVESQPGEGTCITVRVPIVP